MAIILLGLVPGNVGADPAESPPLVLESDLYSYTLAVPDGWAHSFDQASEFGVSLVLHAKGSDFHSSNSVMYATELCKRECRGASSRETAAVLDNARAASPALVVEEGKPIQTKSGAAAKVRILSGARDSRQKREALAFIAHPEVIVLLVLSTKDTSSWDSDFAAFRQAVAGYQLFTCETPGLRLGCRKKSAPWTPEQFDSAVKSAEANEATPDWQAYRGPFFQQLGPLVQRAMQRCFPEVGKASADRFTLVFAVRGDGGLAQSMVRPEAPDTTCVLESINAARLPAPPRPDWWVAIEMKITP